MSACVQPEVVGDDSGSACVAAGVASAVVSQGVDVGEDASALTASADDIPMRCVPFSGDGRS